MRSFRFHALIIGGYTLLSVVLTYPVILHLATHIPFNPFTPVNVNHYPRELMYGVGDHWYFLWALGFIEHLVASRRWSLVTDAIFYPRGVDLTYPTLFGFGLPLTVLIPFVRMFGVIVTYNLFTIGSFVVTAYSTFLLVRYLTHDGRAAFVSGIIFAFSPYHMARALGHFNFLTSGMWIPLYVLFLMRAVNGGRLPDLVAAPLLLTLTMAANPYYAAFLGLFTVLYVLYQLRSVGGPVVNKVLLTRLLSIGGIASLVLVPFAWLLFTRGLTNFYVSPPLSESSIFGADLLAFFVPSPYHPLWWPLTKPLYDHFASSYTERYTEQTVYIGYMVIALSSVAVLKVAKEEMRLWLLSALAFLVLSLGSFLHINGSDLLKLGGMMSIALPLPNLLFHFIPGLNAMRVPSRFSVMLMLALAVLAGYGTRHLLKRLENRPGAAALSLGLIVSIIAFEFLGAPLPLVDASIPTAYERIAKDGGKGGTLLDVPLDWRVTRYEYYQTTHRKRLIFGQAPRLSLSIDANYADSVPFVRFFKDPESIKHYDESGLDKRDVLRFIQFFDLGFIVLHREYLEPEAFARLKRFLLDHFPVRRVEEDDRIVALYLARDGERTDLWLGPDGYLLDFDSATPQFFLTEGWSRSETWGDLTVAWSDAPASTLWLYLPRASDLTMELRLLPFSYPSATAQGIKVVVNGRYLQDIQLAQSGWQSYSVKLPSSVLSPGINAIRFVYRYTASPSQVIPGSQDPRRLAVAYDKIVLRQE